ncbi:hypothetical protein BH23GEM6_BH23GEM6_24390 [soil metagenome]
MNMVYADSQTPISADGYRFTDNPSIITGARHSFAVIEQLPCDILITPHPGASDLWKRLEAGTDGLIDSNACRRYAEAARQQLQRRLATEAVADPL